MGMPISVDVPACATDTIFDECFSRLHEIDSIFSTYHPNTEVSRYRSGSLKLQNTSKDFMKVMGACKEIESNTRGYFSAWYGGTYDPSGYVKGWSIEQVATLLRQHKLQTFYINAGGDVLVSSNSSKTWNIGIADPQNRMQTIGVISLRNGAIATSGTYEKGAHIINPKTASKATEVLSVTVCGPDIIRADILATTVCAMGVAKGKEYIENQPDYEAMIISAAAELSFTSNFQRS